MAAEHARVGAVPAPGDRPRLVAGGIAWIASTLGYFVAQGFVAAAWVHPSYSWSSNYISDLGNTACGLFAVPHGTKVLVCSPRHTSMNAAFVLTGVLVIVGALLLRRLWPERRLSRIATWLFVISGMGKVVVGLVPENTRIGLHLLGALNVPVIAVAMVLVSWAMLPFDRSLAIVGLVLAAIALVGTVLSTAGQFTHGLYLGLGVGGMERISDYPTSLWLLLLGVIAVASPAAVTAPHHLVDVAVSERPVDATASQRR
jgi:hypothetical membrane protein